MGESSGGEEEGGEGREDGKKNIILKKRRAPVQINLPNGRSLRSRWKRISRKQLPINIKVARSRAIGRKNKK